MCTDVIVETCSLRVFFFKQKTAYEMRISDWSSDVCSSDLLEQLLVIAFPESAEDRGGIRERRGVHPRRIGDQLGRCLAIDDQDAAKHTMFAHQVFVGGYFAFTAFAFLVAAFVAVAALRARRQDQRRGEPGTSDQARSEEHTSELQSLMRISYAVFCLK